jgi:spermidine synthase
VTRIAVDSVDSVANRVGAVYVANTVGSILGAPLVSFGLLPALGVRGAFVSLILVNLGIGSLLVLRARPNRDLGVAAVGILAMAAVFVLVPSNLFMQQFANRFGDILFYREEVTDTVMVTEDDMGRMIRYADGRGTAGTMTWIENWMYTHLPLMIHPDPKRMLHIGFGVGNSLSAALRHPLEHVDCVELSPGVIDAAPFFRATNRDALADPRVNLVIQDGRNYLLTSPDRYDVIHLEPPELHTAGVANLYTREFYERARDHLTEDGIFSIWINVGMTPEEDVQMILRTMASVFPHVSVWHGPLLYSWIANGSNVSLDPDLGRLAEGFANPALRSDLDAMGIPSPFHLLNYFLFADQEVAEFAGEGPLVLDDHTRLDFSVPRSQDAFFGIANYNTNFFMVDLIEARKGELRSLQVEKMLKMTSYKRPVLPHVVGIDSSGLEHDEVQRRIEAAGQRMLRSQP